MGKRVWYPDRFRTLAKNRPIPVNSGDFPDARFPKVHEPHFTIFTNRHAISTTTVA
ncbi:hypothetical protein C8R42DRAFT_664298 [Lentinula raphanica]|nr:hypothetical protein C8R42DRAFT_664298 [Lentinula raphanica]